MLYFGEIIYLNKTKTNTSEYVTPIIRLHLLAKSITLTRQITIIIRFKTKDFFFPNLF